MNFDPTLLMLSLIPSGVGFVLFIYGKKRERWPQLVAGVVLMAYPYFTGTVAAMLGVGVLVGGALYVMIQLGW
jgi:hypothetical protein